MNTPARLRPSHRAAAAALVACGLALPALVGAAAPTSAPLAPSSTALAQSEHGEPCRLRSTLADAGLDLADLVAALPPTAPRHAAPVTPPKPCLDFKRGLA
jgi:hypothetical protein